MVANNTRQISYTVKVISTDMAGSRAPDLVYKELVPASLVCASPPEYETKAVLASLSTKHHEDIMKTRKWKCWNCDRPAVSMLHNPMSYLNRVNNPEIVDISLGVCENRGRCDMKGREFFKAEMEIAQRMSAPPTKRGGRVV